MPSIQEAFPAFHAELTALVEASARPELAAQVADLPVVDRCRCGEKACAHFYTAPKPSGGYGAGHSNVLLPAARGLIVLDVVHDRIVAVELLDRPDVKAILDSMLPAR